MLIEVNVCVQIISGEMFPPHLKDVPGLEMELPSSIPVSRDNVFALGHPFFVLLPGLFVRKFVKHAQLGTKYISCT